MVVCRGQPQRFNGRGSDRIGANLKKVMEEFGEMDDVILFIDEFEEIAGNRDDASRIDKSITKEFLKQVPLLKTEQKKSFGMCN